MHHLHIINLSQVNNALAIASVNAAQLAQPAAPSPEYERKCADDTEGGGLD